MRNRKEILPRFFKISLTIGFISTFCFSQSLKKSEHLLTGNLRIDLLQYQFPDSAQNTVSDERKSPFTAAIYSAIIPGAGQLYTESYYAAIGFVGVEVTAWIVYSIYNSKGNKATAEFQDYADLHWSVVQYAQWMIQYFPSEASGITINSNTNLPPWERVNWPQINDAEEKISLRQPATGFTHRLPIRPEQQYFELIGKYPQYGGGWDDAPGFTPSDVLSGNVSEKFLLYSRMRGDANSLYRVAVTASSLIIANHVLSALEAAWSAARFNSSLKAEAHLVPRQWAPGIVEFVPTAVVKVEF